MSRAFVNEDNFVDDLPDRQISEQPNLVTGQGFALIESALAEAQRAYGEAQTSGDRDALAKAGRELRYWSARRATARVIPVVPDSATVQFGSAVTLIRDDGRKQTFRIVGEDEADPAKGTISHVSPVARALLGRSVGDTVRAGREDAEITAIS
jgi:transcription elongation GreA/GreB family factor